MFLSVLGRVCVDNTDCLLDGLVCTSSVCVCASGTTPYNGHCVTGMYNKSLTWYFQVIKFLITNKNISFMLYGGINLYFTVRLYFSLQRNIYLVCRCLHNADVVLYPGTPQ